LDRRAAGTGSNKAKGGRNDSTRSSPSHQPVATEIDVGSRQAAAQPDAQDHPGRAGLLLMLFIYHVLSDRYTPYTSQARVETFLTQVAPEVAGDVLEVGVKDNGAVRKGQLLFRIDPEPYELAVRAAEANLAVALQGADVSVADIAAARAQIASSAPTSPPAASWARSSPTSSTSARLPKPRHPRPRRHGKTEADLTRAQADLRKAQANLGAPGFAIPKVRQALAALDQARLDLRNTDGRLRRPTGSSPTCAWRPANMSRRASRC
jgi:multidrug resistance efflux pump